MSIVDKNLEYYRKNAEEDYNNTPISVLRYITELETSELLQQNTELLEALKELTNMCYKLKMQHLSYKVKICLEAKEQLIQKHETK